MTKEQIKQNAEAYFDSLTTIHLGIEENESNSIVEAFIAGAHSRDEEIKELNNLLEARRESLFQSTKCVTELEMENNKLCNPWISVEERLPEESSDSISIPVAGITESV